MTPFFLGCLRQVHRAASPGCTRCAHTKPVVGNARSGYCLVTTSAVHALRCGVMVRPGSACPWRLRNFGRIGDLNHRRANRVTAPRKPRPSLSQGSEAGVPKQVPTRLRVATGMRQPHSLSADGRPQAPRRWCTTGLGRAKSTASGPPLALVAKPRLSSGHLVPLELQHPVRSGGDRF